MRIRLKVMLYGIIALLVLGGGSIYMLARASIHPPSMNMGVMGHGIGEGHMGTMDGISVTSLREETSDAPIKLFELTADETELDIGGGGNVSMPPFQERTDGSISRLHLDFLRIVYRSLPFLQARIPCL
ncbi:hypothetical protein FE783_33990 [Paenibacillus mesophilus]|uniref:hypothetical protein n=1 Tax=Paenibacillus mesophilus TaxID=2582849 RepID=UPI00110E4A32|nr:hypothetical protein [Paenibacillus mesophilus]TMV43915.1 hypothetical protein FE783_33990 [Paenibacillus mesophilus]